jgi:hypothetical protein
MTELKKKLMNDTTWAWANSDEVIYGNTYIKEG